MMTTELRQTEEKLKTYFKNLKYREMLNDRLEKLNKQRREIELLTPMLNTENPELVKLLENVNAEILKQNVMLLDYEKSLTQVEFAFGALDALSQQIIISRYRDKKALKKIGEELFI